MCVKIKIWLIKCEITCKVLVKWVYYIQKEFFFVRTAVELIPVEVKSNNNSSKSLATLIKGEKYTDIKYGIKISAGNIGYADNIYTMPYFCTFLLKRFLKNK